MDDNQPILFEFPPESIRKKEFRRLNRPIWTENKAKLIERYLYYFVLITKHGTYIDGFSGPQEPDKPEMWSAKLVLESNPQWFKNFHLFEQDPHQIIKLEELKKDFLKSSTAKRTIEIYPGDFNLLIHKFLDKSPIKEREATFCLLDQRTFECHWSSLVKIGGYKKTGYKIELFYFLPAAWLDRAISAVKNMDILYNWWGNAEWSKLLKLKSDKRSQYVASRIKDELVYENVTSWPIFSKQRGGRVMYYMIHATDHPLAPGLMYRAYHNALSRKESPEQLQFEYGSWKPDDQN